VAAYSVYNRADDGGFRTRGSATASTAGRMSIRQLHPRVDNTWRTEIANFHSVDPHATDERHGLLLSGATGFLGGELLARLLERSERPVYALVRAQSDEEASRRLRRAIASLLGNAEPWSRRAVAVAADITRPDLGMDPVRRAWLAERVDRIVHCAATVSFTLGLEESRATNVGGTRSMLDFAEFCARRGGLECFTHISTAYVAGTHRGLFGEGELDVEQGFRNPYERSKFEAERMLRERADSLPLQVLRPSIVVGDSRTGWTPSFNVLYGPLRAVAKGLYPAIPARRSSPVDVVPVDYVAEATLALAGRPGTTYHLTAGERASSVGEIVELTSAYLERPAPPVLPPGLYRRAIHPLLVRSGSEKRKRSLRRSETYFPYFDMRARYDDALARDALVPLGIEAPPLSSYFTRLVDFAIAADWGRRRPARRAPAMALPSALPGQDREPLIAARS
jgi:thioester reductase-like protein